MIHKLNFYISPKFFLYVTLGSHLRIGGSLLFPSIYVPAAQLWTAFTSAFILDRSSNNYMKFV